MLYPHGHQLTSHLRILHKRSRGRGGIDKFSVKIYLKTGEKKDDLGDRLVCCGHNLPIQCQKSRIQCVVLFLCEAARSTNLQEAKV